MSAILCIVPIAIAVLLWQTISLPPMKAQRQPRTGNVFKLLKRPLSAPGMASMAALLSSPSATASQFAITMGAVVGGLLFDVSGYQSTFAAGAILLIVAAILAFLTSRRAIRQQC